MYLGIKDAERTFIVKESDVYSLQITNGGGLVIDTSRGNERFQETRGIAVTYVYDDNISEVLHRINKKTGE